MHHLKPCLGGSIGPFRITTIAAGFGLALVLGFIAERLKLPALVGYLLAGIVIGPATPGFVADSPAGGAAVRDRRDAADVRRGPAFLARRSAGGPKRIAVPGAVVQMAVATLLGMALAWSWGWSWAPAWCSACRCRWPARWCCSRRWKRAAPRLGERAHRGGLAGGGRPGDGAGARAAAAPGRRARRNRRTNASGRAAMADRWPDPAAQVSAFVALMLVVGRRLFPWLLWQVTRTGSRELFTLCVVAAAVGIAFGAASLFGVSFALGAFFAGMVMRESEFSHRAAEESLPLRDAFAVLFFVSVGMLFDPPCWSSEPPASAGGGRGHHRGGKSIAATRWCCCLPLPAEHRADGRRQPGPDRRVLLHPGGLGLSLGLLPPEGQSLIVAGALISIALNPLVFTMVEPVRAWVLRRSALARRLETRADPTAALPMSTERKYLEGQVVLVGHGRVGRRIAQALGARGIPFVVAEQNREQVERLREQGIAAVSGDAAEPEVLVQAHIATAAMLVIATPDPVKTRRMIETARTLNPAIEVVLRTHGEEEAMMLRKEDIARVFFGEEELAKGMASHVLERFAPGA
jgi:CPA2 family monovalent cation:H+ antiporter-2